MATTNTYTQLYIHLVFAVHNRESLITPELEPQLYKMLTTILNNNGHTTIAINGMSDHVHVFFSMRPNEALSHLAQELKRSTSLWINKNNLVRGHFSWQEGFGAFSYSQSQIDAVAKYVRSQKEHHKQRTFHDEYIDILKKFNIQYDEKYTFYGIEDTEATPLG